MKKLFFLLVILSSFLFTSCLTALIVDYYFNKNQIRNDNLSKEKMTLVIRNNCAWQIEVYVTQKGLGEPQIVTVNKEPVNIEIYKGTDYRYSIQGAYDSSSGYDEFYSTYDDIMYLTIDWSLYTGHYSSNISKPINKTNTDSQTVSNSQS